MSASSLTWTSTDKNVATVKNGVITAKKNGKTYITAQMKNSKSNKIKFLLLVYKSEKSIKFTNVDSSYVLEVGKSVKLTPSAKGTYSKYSTSDSRIISVKSDGTITAKKAGTVKITYVTVGKYYCKATVNVTVGKRVTKVKTGVSDNVLILLVGDSYTLQPSVTPSNAANKALSYTSDSKKIVSVDKNGVVKANSAGTSKITIKAVDGSGKNVVLKVIAVDKANTISPENVVTKVIAHRGLSGVAPENTLPAFELAGQSGFDEIECDVQMTSDGELIIMHDNNLFRMCGIDKYISEVTFEEIRQYDVIYGVNANKYPNNKIPTLDEFIACCNKYNCTPVVEIKGNFTDAALSKVYASISKSVKAPVVISFYRYNLRWLRAKDANIELRNLVKEVNQNELNFCRTISVDMAVKASALTVENLRSMQKEGIKVSVWGAKTASEFNYFKELKVNSVSTDTIY